MIIYFIVNYLYNHIFQNILQYNYSYKEYFDFNFLHNINIVYTSEGLFGPILVPNKLYIIIIIIIYLYMQLKLNFINCMFDKYTFHFLI